MGKMEQKSHVFKRAIACLMVVLILLTSAPLAGIDGLVTMKASAATNHSQSEAVEWIKARGNENWWQDVDNAYGCQCVDLIMAYYRYLIGYNVWGNAKDYLSTSKLPSGWYMDTTPSPGAIIVWGGNTWTGQWTTGSNGHVGLVYSVSGSNVYTVETNTGGTNGYGTAAAAKFRTRVNCNAKFIHPDFSGSSGGVGEMVEPVVAMPRFVFHKGERVRITWTATPACSNFYQYWIVLDNKTTGKREFEGASSASAGDAAANYFEFTANTLGDYGLGIYAVPYAQSGASKYTYSTFKVTDTEMKIPTITLSKQAYSVGETVNITWEKTSSDSDFYQYWVVIDNKTTDVRVFGGSPGVAGDVNANSYSFVPSVEGNYRIDVYAVPYYNKDARQKVSTKTITVTKKCVHSFTSKTTTAAYLKSAATCISPAVYYYKCTKCSEKGSSTYTYGTAVGHKYETSIVAATCTANGVKTYTCSVCGNSYTETIAKTGHKYNSGKITKTPTCVKTGVKTYTCTVCGVKKKETIAKDPNNHSDAGGLDSWNYIEPSCTKNGYSGDWYCSDCDGLVQKGEVIKKTGHKDKNKDDYCDNCGKYLRKDPVEIKGAKVTAQTSKTITGTWKKTGGSGTVYRLFIRKNGDKYFEHVGSTKSNKYTFKKLKPGTKYEWFVVVWNPDGSDKAISDDVKTATLPSAPSIKVTVGKKKADVKWGKVTRATNYTVYYSTSKNSGYKKAGTTSGKSYTVYKLKPGKTYYFKVVANKKVGSKTYTSAYSKIVSAKIKK